MRKQIQNLVVSAAVSGNPVSFSIPYLPFQPDDIIFYGFVWFESGSTTKNVVLSSDLVNNYEILSFSTKEALQSGDDAITANFSSQIYQSLNIIFNNVNNINMGNTYSISFKDINGSSATLTGRIKLYIRFVKYLDK